MADTDKIKARLHRMRPQEAGTPWWRRMALPAVMLATGLAGGAYVATVQPSETAAPPPMPTSEVREFQDDTGLAGFTLTETEPALVPEPAVARTGQLQRPLQKQVSHRFLAPYVIHRESTKYLRRHSRTTAIYTFLGANSSS